MRRAAILVVGFFLITVVATAQSDPVILEFKTMAAVTGPYVGAANPIRGLSGGGVPWVIADGKGKLRADGRVEVKVRGLVLASTGANPVPNFRAVVSCQSIDGMGSPSIVNVSTEDFPASPTGDADIRATVELPSPCFAPIIFVTNSTGRWFAVTGF
jgi:hypothetical protein